MSSTATLPILSHQTLRRCSTVETMHLLLILAALLPASVPALVASAQVFPERLRRGALPVSTAGETREPQSEAERLELERRAQYRQLFPPTCRPCRRPPTRPCRCRSMGCSSRRLRTPGAPLGVGAGSTRARTSLPPAGTPVRSAAAGHVYRVGEARLGGNVVLVVGAGGRRYY